MTIKLNARARQNIEEWIEAWAKLGGHRQDAANLTMLLAAHDAAAELLEALRFYANPEIYKPHPDGPAFDRRDLSYHARATIAKFEGGN